MTQIGRLTHYDAFRLLTSYVQNQLICPIFNSKRADKAIAGTQNSDVSNTFADTGNMALTVTTCVQSPPRVLMSTPDGTDTVDIVATD